MQVIAGDGRGGADRVALALGKALRALGHRVSYVVRPSFLLNHNLHAMGYDVVTYPEKASERRDFMRAARKVDVLLTHDSGSRHLALRAKLFGMQTPVWFMRHCISGTSRFGGTLLHRLLVARQLAISDVVTQSLLDAGYPAARVHRLYGSVDLTPFLHPDEQTVKTVRQRWLSDVGVDVLIIGIVARFNIYAGWTPQKIDLKGYDTLFAALSKFNRPYRVLVVGPRDAQDHDALRQMAAHYGADPQNLIFLGFVQDMAPIYKLMQVNVLPSRNEGLGLSVIEGMAAGVASIASRSGGLIEIVRDEENGLSFDVDDANALAHCLNRLADDHELRTLLARNGQSDVLERFDVRSLAHSVLDLMQ
ncbi:MAG: glycosyltransferase family 4 protein [Halothiobacillaceae bacterium]